MVVISADRVYADPLDLIVVNEVISANSKNEDFML